ncbi:MAG: hypothetical protein RR140_00560 [Clostridia bacterium]
MKVKQNELEKLVNELETKSSEYKILCEKLCKIEPKTINENNENLVKLYDEFKNNNVQITEINNRLKKLKKEQ